MVANGTNFMFIAKNSFPQNESLLKSVARLIFQLRFLIIWIFLKTIRWIRPNTKNDYQKDLEFIEASGYRDKMRALQKLKKSF